MQRLHTQLPSGPATTPDCLPTLAGLSLHPGVHSLTGALRFKTCRLFAPGRFLLRDAGGRVFQVDLLIFVHFSYEDFPVIGQAPQKVGVLAIPTIGAHPTETHTVLSSVQNHLEG